MSSTSANTVFSIGLICDNILSHMSESTTKDILDLRLINHEFDQAVLRKIREEHKTLVIEAREPTEAPEDLPMEDEEYSDNDDDLMEDEEDIEMEDEEDLEMEDEEDIEMEDEEELAREELMDEDMELDEDEEQIREAPDSFWLNEKKVDFVDQNWIRFLVEVARIEPHTLSFQGFGSYEEEDQQVHDIVYSFLRSAEHIRIKRLIGSNDICPNGCDQCQAIVENCIAYGPIQMNTVLPSGKHFEKISIGEEYLPHMTTILNEAHEQGKFSEALSTLIPPTLSCRHIEFIFSDRLHESTEVPRLPLSLIEHIVTTWQVSEVTVKLMSGYSDLEHNAWSNKHRLFTEVQLTDELRKVRVQVKKIPRFGTIKKLTIDLFCATHMTETMMDSKTHPEFMNAIAVLRKIFPSQSTFIDLPLDLQYFAFAKQQGMVENVAELTWHKTPIRGDELFIRAYIAVSEQQELPWKEKAYIHNFPVTIKVDNSTWLKEKFSIWPSFGISKKRASETITVSEPCNNRLIHFQFNKTR